MNVEWLMFNEEPKVDARRGQSQREDAQSMYDNENLVELKINS